MVDRALSIADVEGLEAVTIRRLVREFGVTPRAPYWYFKDKEELLDALADRLVSEIDLTVDRSASWQRQLRALLESLVAVCRAHPATAVLLGTRNNASEAALRATEVALDILRRAGFSPAEATTISRQALRATTALVTEQPAFTSTRGDREQQRAREGTRAFLESLPVERFPRVVEAAEPLSACDDPEAHFELGLDLVLAGIDAAASHRARPPFRG